VHDFVTRNTYRLCSFKNPAAEAASWLQGLTLPENPKSILIFGLGCGFHVLEFAKKYPDIKVSVYDIDFIGLEFFKSLATEVLNDNSKITFIQKSQLANIMPQCEMIIPFLPAWQGALGEFQSDFESAIGFSNENLQSQLHWPDQKTEALAEILSELVR
jgi:hypothetical protein